MLRILVSAAIILGTLQISRAQELPETQKKELVSTGPADGARVKLGEKTLTFKFLTTDEPAPRLETTE